ncbi:SGNH/GDSL hydrolase family protein [Haloferula chungangensis]|uniref:SGNH/GDSL hydrolase family protein n=1 Tax=Haloferula chungangensis TaxID=1048331 RepID=UPI0036D3A47B
MNPVTKLVSEKHESIRASDDVILFGDSRVDQWCNLPFSATSKIGIGGATAAELAWGLDSVLEGKFSQIAYVQCGINDLKYLGVMEGDFENSVKRCVGDIQKIAKRLKALGAESVVVIGIFPIGEIPIVRKPFWSDEIDAARLEVNKLLSEQSGEYEYIDCDDVLNDASCFRDELHLSPMGYERVNRVVRASRK